MRHANERRGEGVDRESVAVGVAEGEGRRGEGAGGRKSSEGGGEVNTSHWSSGEQEEERERAKSS